MWELFFKVFNPHCVCFFNAISCHFFLIMSSSNESNDPPSPAMLCCADVFSMKQLISQKKGEFVSFHSLMIHRLHWWLHWRCIGCMGDALMCWRCIDALIALCCINALIALPQISVCCPWTPLSLHGTTWIAVNCRPAGQHCSDCGLYCVVLS